MRVKTDEDNKTNEELIKILIVAIESNNDYETIVSQFDVNVG